MENIKNFYISQIEDNFYPYWQKFFDNEYGGILNCINNYGDEKICDDKFTWSQGRWLWILAKLYSLCQNKTLTKINSEELCTQMHNTYRFLIEKSIYGDTVCCYLLDRKGNKLIDKKTNRYDASIFADCFALIGMAQYSKALNLKCNEPVVTALYNSILQRVESNNFLTEPYPIPQGYKVHSIPMILVNTIYEVIDMRKAMQLPCENEISTGTNFALQILQEFENNGQIREHISTQENYHKKMLDRHVNPGHTLEDMWFIGEFLQSYAPKEEAQIHLNKIKNIAQTAFDIGWDNQYGGLLRFVDKDGGMPKGEFGNSDFEKLIKETWDMKLWWPHSEVLYTFLYLYKATNDEKMYQNYKKACEYVFKTFPNEELGEWVQIRKRDGKPQEKLVALPVKDPFHIMRNFIKIVELYND